MHRLAIDDAPAAFRRLAASEFPAIQAAEKWLLDNNIITESLTQRFFKDAEALGKQVTQQATDSFSRRLTKLVGRAFGEGWSVDRWKSELSRTSGVYLSQEETVYRTYTHRAYVEGQREVLSGPAGDLFPYRLFLATQDSRVRDEHAELDGLVYHQDSPTAARAASALDDWNCRCNEIPLTREDAESRGIDDG